jgi:hypothetical protein
MEIEKNIIPKYFDLHNKGIESGNFEQLLTLFSSDAILSFEGINIGPFVGKESIAKAFSIYPPVNKIFALDVAEKEGVHVVDYALAPERDKISGKIRIQMTKNNLINKLIIDVDENSITS